MTIQSRAHGRKRAHGLNGLRGDEYISEMRGCAYKLAFPSRRKAAAKARVWCQHPYKCRHCKKWHLTKKRPS